MNEQLQATKATYNLIPSLDEITAERSRLQTQREFRHFLWSTIKTLLVVAAVAILLSLLFLPIFKVTGTSMNPNLNEGEIVIAIKTNTFQTGDICSFTYNNQQLIKRVIAKAGDWVLIDDSGNVYVNNQMLDEPYVQDKALGFNDQKYPYQVPDGKVFVLGDHRSTSIDSRSAEVGAVPVDDIVGKLIGRIWPLTRISAITR